MFNDGLITVAEGRRLAWYAFEPDPQHWLEHWRTKVTHRYYDQARRALAGDELGQVLLETFPKEGRVLEAGCGAGRYVAALLSVGYDVEGIDSSRALIELVKEKEPALPVRWGDATEVAEPDASYSSYLSVGVVEHRQEGPEPFLDEAHRLLRPGGRAVFTVPSFGPLRQIKARLGRYQRKPPPLPFFQYGFRAEELAAYVARAGFQVDDVRYQGLYRLLAEEVPGYWRLTTLRGGDRIRRGLDRLVAGRDGHMAVVVATKPG